MDQYTLNLLMVGASFALYIGIAIWMRISEERDSRFAKSRTAVSLIPGQPDVVDFRLPG